MANTTTVNKNISLHTPDLIVKNAQAVFQQAVVAKTMPLANATQMTDAERSLIGRWFESGAPTH